MTHPQNPSVLLMQDGTVRKYTDIGCYPLYYIAADMEPLCAKCVQDHIDVCTDTARVDTYAEQWFVVAHEVNWEDPDLHCAHCEQRIESAYAEPEAT